VAASRVTDELTSLEQARSRLEAALSSDEHWRALQSVAHDDVAEASAARRARNTRLKMALAENPLYQAWKHVNEAIDALRDGGADTERSAAPSPRDGQTVAAPGDLAPVGHTARGHAGSLVGRLQANTPFQGAGHADDPPPSELGQVVPPAAEKSPPMPPPIPRTPVGIGAADPEEATVTFVRREPLLASVEPPAELGAEPASSLLARLRAPSREPEPREEAFAPPDGGSEEAEVVIVTVESARERREAEERAGTIRRLRKALSGD
jgi:hypothetical protein